MYVRFRCAKHPAREPGSGPLVPGTGVEIYRPGTLILGPYTSVEAEPDYIHVCDGGATFLVATVVAQGTGANEIRLWQPVGTELAFVSAKVIMMAELLQHDWRESG